MAKTVSNEKPSQQRRKGSERCRKGTHVAQFYVNQLITLISAVLMTILVSHTRNMRQDFVIKKNDWIWVQVFAWAYGVLELTRFTFNCGAIWWALKLDAGEEHEEQKMLQSNFEGSMNIGIDYILMIIFIITMVLIDPTIEMIFLMVLIGFRMIFNAIIGSANACANNNNRSK